ncbi:hypothetical protein DB728_01380 [Rhizobium leguminosarum bv. viciae USDA 2370]|nr:hypothetical protein CHR56_30830 [Rhizobium leguminosarum bv. viciae]OOO41029.1 hypothetical protein BS629_34175 [Rhizobium leguminosarum bv. viciae USDA 2370]PUB65845.1 hypothetical protein DB728_01380 [Rhizobium leguminosarum bv. viciae USDA 2370]
MDAAIIGPPIEHVMHYLQQFGNDRVAEAMPTGKTTAIGGCFSIKSAAVRIDTAELSHNPWNFSPASQN